MNIGYSCSQCGTKFESAVEKFRKTLSKEWFKTTHYFTEGMTLGLGHGLGTGDEHWGTTTAYGSMHQSWICPICDNHNDISIKSDPKRKAFEEGPEW